MVSLSLQICAVRKKWILRQPETCIPWPSVCAQAKNHEICSPEKRENIYEQQSLQTPFIHLLSEDKIFIGSKLFMFT